VSRLEEKPRLGLVLTARPPKPKVSEAKPVQVEPVPEPPREHNVPAAIVELFELKENDPHFQIVNRSGGDYPLSNFAQPVEPVGQTCNTQDVPDVSSESLDSDKPSQSKSSRRRRKKKAAAEAPTVTVEAKVDPPSYEDWPGFTRQDIYSVQPPLKEVFVRDRSASHLRKLIAVSFSPHRLKSDKTKILVKMAQDYLVLLEDESWLASQHWYDLRTPETVEWRKKELQYNILHLLGGFPKPKGM
jgi:hypothetical protein